MPPSVSAPQFTQSAADEGLARSTVLPHALRPDWTTASALASADPRQDVAADNAGTHGGEYSLYHLALATAGTGDQGALAGQQLRKFCHLMHSCPSKKREGSLRRIKVLIRSAF
jgi:hypothetical protein